MAMKMKMKMMKVLIEQTIRMKINLLVLKDKIKLIDKNQSALLYFFNVIIVKLIINYMIFDKS
jgi:hypothetical protein